MNILVTNHWLKKLGGSETFTYTLIAALKKAGHDVDLFTNQPGLVSDRIATDLKVYSKRLKDSYDLILANHNTCVRSVYDRGPVIQTCHGIYPKLEQPSDKATAWVSISREVKNYLFNLHASLLPDYRGAAPIHWAVINGEVETGVTTFFIDAQIDTGQIILQEKTNVGPEETTGLLYGRLRELGAKLVLTTVQQIESGAVTTRPQKHLETPKNAPKLTTDNTRLQWEGTQKEIFDKVRGLCPHPGAWTYFKNTGDPERIKIFASKRDSLSTEAPTGSLFQNGKRLLVRTADGWLEILEMQLPGKRRMFVEDILNGLEIQKNARFL